MMKKLLAIAILVGGVTLQDGRPTVPTKPQTEAGEIFASISKQPSLQQLPDGRYGLTLNYKGINRLLSLETPDDDIEHSLSLYTHDQLSDWIDDYAEEAVVKYQSTNSWFHLLLRLQEVNLLEQFKQQVEEIKPKSQAYLAAYEQFEGYQKSLPAPSHEEAIKMLEEANQSQTNTEPTVQKSTISCIVSFCSWLLCNIPTLMQTRKTSLQTFRDSLTSKEVVQPYSSQKEADAGCFGTESDFSPEQDDD